ncbi:MAG TPA: dimethylsulfonioproprionate lyase family protein [Pseudomonadales bacterium]|nr:dimethylsulfonioproprionate lyase family protein [Pseudomonadales bacterium]
MTSASDAESEWGDLTAGLISLLGEPRLNAIAARLDATVLPTSQQCAANHLRAALQLATSETRRICVSIDRLASTLQWRQNPNYAGADFLDSYAYCELVGPHGHLQHAQVALGLLLLGPRVTYPEHAHPATETYGVIAGHAEWFQGDGLWRRRMPGELIRHATMEPHAMRTADEPLLAAYLWQDHLDDGARLLSARNPRTKEGVPR